MITNTSTSYSHYRQKAQSQNEKPLTKTYQKYVHDSPISKLVTLNQSNVNVEAIQKQKSTSYNYSHSNNNQKQIEQIRQRYKNINLREVQKQKQNKYDAYEQRKRTTQYQYKNTQYDDQFQRIIKNNQLISNRQKKLNSLCTQTQTTFQPRSTFQQFNKEKKDLYQDVKKSFLQKISEASNSNYQTFRQSARQQSNRGRAVSHQEINNKKNRNNQIQKSYQNYETNQLRRIKDQLERRQKRLENLRNQDRNSKPSEAQYKYQRQQIQQRENVHTPKRSTYTNEENKASDPQSPWFRHASSIYNQSYQNSDKKYSPNQISSRLDSINQNYFLKQTVTQQQSATKKSMKSTLLYSNQKPISTYREGIRNQNQNLKTRKVILEDQNKVKEIQNKIKQRENEFRAREEQLRQKYAQVSNLSITNNRQQKINEFKLSDKHQQKPDKKETINTEIQNIEKKIKQFQSMKKKLNIQFQPYALEKSKNKVNQKSSSSIRHQRSVSVYDKQIKKTANNEENPYERVRQQRQFTKPTPGQKRSTFIQNTKPMYSQNTLNGKRSSQNNTKSNGFAFQLFRIQSETEQSSSNVSNISRIPSNTQLPSRSPSQKYLNQMQIQKKADGGIQERKKKLQQKVQSNHCIKQLVSLLSQQAILDEQFRNTKIWFEGLNNTDKWKQLKYSLREKGLNFTVQDDKISQFILSQDQNNPFFSINQHSKFSIQYMIQCYQKCQDHWKQQIKGKFNQQQLASENFTQKKFDLDKKGYIVIQDLVRFLNIESGTFYRNRDLAIISRRFNQIQNENNYCSQQTEQVRIKFINIMKCLTNNKY